MFRCDAYLEDVSIYSLDRDFCKKCPLKTMEADNGQLYSDGEFMHNDATMHCIRTNECEQIFKYLVRDNDAFTRLFKMVLDERGGC